MQVRSSHPELTVNEVQKTLNDAWRQCSKELKQQYKVKAQEVNAAKAVTADQAQGTYSSDSHDDSQEEAADEASFHLDALRLDQQQQHGQQHQQHQQHHQQQQHADWRDVQQVPDQDKHCKVDKNWQPAFVQHNTQQQHYTQAQGSAQSDQYYCHQDHYQSEMDVPVKRQRVEPMSHWPEQQNSLMAGTAACASVEGALPSTLPPGPLATAEPVKGLGDHPALLLDDAALDLGVMLSPGPAAISLPQPAVSDCSAVHVDTPYAQEPAMAAQQQPAASAEILDTADQDPSGVAVAPSIALTVFAPNPNMVGAKVEGIIEEVTGAGYLATVSVNGFQYKAVLFSPYLTLAMPGNTGLTAAVAGPNTPPAD